MGNMVIPVLVIVAIFASSLRVLFEIRLRQREQFILFGRDGLIALWVVTLALWVVFLVGWLSGPHPSHRSRLLKTIASGLLMLSSISTVIYAKRTKKD